MANIKEGFKNFGKTVKEASNEIFEKIKGNLSDLEQDTITLTHKMYSSVYMYFHNSTRKSIVSFLLSLGGVTVGAGLAMIPIVGFILGFLIGVFLEDSYRNKIKDTFQHSKNKIITIAKNLTHSIQDNWEKFVAALNADMAHLEEHKEHIEEYAKEIGATAKDIEMKIEKNS